ncbi:MAG: LssY C-terminal domain-containing protein, partial [Bryobacteraceae bacterium]|nr:LssY C-terminal domain-containing protein [Bryobacteraceae bacterium]
TMRGDPRAPVSKLLHEGNEPDLVFQKSLNTVASRHHIRIWKAPEQDGLWIGAATHDVGVSFEVKLKMLSHRIDPEIDRERMKIVIDMNAAGCSQRVSTIERELPDSPQNVVTDGNMAMIHLQDCPVPAAPLRLAKKRGSLWVGLARRMVLETRQYALRDNAYHWAFLGARAAWRASRKPDLMRIAKSPVRSADRVAIPEALGLESAPGLSKNVPPRP